MKAVDLYLDGMTTTLSGEDSFVELYGRLSNWCDQIREHQRSNDWVASERLIEKSINLLDSMDRLIDVVRHEDMASRIMTLHRFAIRALVRAKTERDLSALEGLERVFFGLAEIFGAMSAK